VGNQGHTILFVSHSMAAITRLCPRTILLDQGKVLSDGPSHEVASEYLSEDLGATATREWSDTSKAPGDEIVRLLAVRVRAENGEIHDVVDIRKPVAIEMEFLVLQGGHELTPNYHFFNEHGVNVFVAGDNDPEWLNRPRPKGRFVSKAWIPGNLLAEGTIIVGAAVTTREPEVIHFFVRDSVAFQVIDSVEGGSARGNYGGHIPGVVRPILKWDTTYTAAPTEAVANTTSR
jgi:homopolymeric O-antigen transport system ATP-binding protein